MKYERTESNIPKGYANILKWNESKAIKRLLSIRFVRCDISVFEIGKIFVLCRGKPFEQTECAVSLRDLNAFFFSSLAVSVCLSLHLLSIRVQMLGIQSHFHTYFLILVD